MQELATRAAVASIFGLALAERWERILALIEERTDLQEVARGERCVGCMFAVSSRDPLVRCVERAIECGRSDAVFVDVLEALRQRGLGLASRCACGMKIPRAYENLGRAAGRRADWKRVEAVARMVLDTESDPDPAAGGCGRAGGPGDLHARERNFWLGCLCGALEGRWERVSTTDSIAVDDAWGRANERCVRETCSKLRLISGLTVMRLSGTSHCHQLMHDAMTHATGLALDSFALSRDVCKKNPPRRISRPEFPTSRVVIARHCLPRPHLDSPMGSSPRHQPLAPGGCLRGGSRSGLRPRIRGLRPSLLDPCDHVRPRCPR